MSYSVIDGLVKSVPFGAITTDSKMVSQLATQIIDYPWQIMYPPRTVADRQPQIQGGHRQRPQRPYWR